MRWGNMTERLLELRRIFTFIGILFETVYRECRPFFFFCMEYSVEISQVS